MGVCLKSRSKENRGERTSFNQNSFFTIRERERRVVGSFDLDFEGVFESFIHIPFWIKDP